MCFHNRYNMLKKEVIEDFKELPLEGKLMSLRMLMARDNIDKIDEEIIVRIFEQEIEKLKYYRELKSVYYYNMSCKHVTKLP